MCYFHCPVRSEVASAISFNAHDEMGGTNEEQHSVGLLKKKVNVNWFVI